MQVGGGGGDGLKAGGSCAKGAEGVTWLPYRVRKRQG